MLISYVQLQHYGIVSHTECSYSFEAMVFSDGVAKACWFKSVPSSLPVKCLVDRVLEQMFQVLPVVEVEQLIDPFDRHTTVPLQAIMQHSSRYMDYD